MSFSSLPMGAEMYYLFVTATNNDISSQNLNSLNGKKIGVNKNSFQEGLLKKWVVAQGINPQIIELTGSERDSLKMLLKGELDALVTVDCYGDDNDYSFLPLVKIGSSDFFFAVNKNRPDLLKELNFAMSKIQEENRFYTEYLNTKYLKTAGTNALISTDELNWLLKHGSIRVGYLDKFAPFCEKSISSELKGVLRNYLNLSKNCLKNTDLHFDTYSYSNLQEAFQALKKGEIDCVFPVHLSTYDAEEMDIATTNPIIETDMYLMMNVDSKKSLSADQEITIATDRTNYNYITFLMDNYPKWKIIECKDLDDALNAVESLKADCALVNNYQATKIVSDKNSLYPIYTGKSIDFAFAVRKNDSEIYYILNKTSRLVSSSSLNEALIEYSSADLKSSFSEFLKVNFYLIVACNIVLIILAVGFVIYRTKQNEKLLQHILEIQEKQK